MKRAVTARTLIAGVVGDPVRHSLSPRLQNAWLEAAGIDAAYLAFAVRPDKFAAFLEGLRGGAVLGLNVTIPYKEKALDAADRADALAQACGAANLLLFHPDGAIEARNTDGEGLIGAFHRQAPALDLTAGPVMILGAGGAARGAAAALLAAGTPQIRIVNRTLARAEALAEQLGPKVTAVDLAGMDAAGADVVAVINATSLGLGGGPGPDAPWSRLPPAAAIMDMVYRPLRTAFLTEASERGHVTVDGLEMLIRQAVPSFQALFGRAPPSGVDARALLLAELELGA